MIAVSALLPTEEVHSLLKTLVLFEFDTLASSLQAEYGDLLQLMEKGIPEIWNEGLHQGQTPVRQRNTQMPLFIFIVVLTLQQQRTFSKSQIIYYIVIVLLWVWSDMKVDGFVPVYSIFL